jgi:hypothetical protein
MLSPKPVIVREKLEREEMNAILRSDQIHRSVSLKNILLMELSIMVRHPPPLICARSGGTGVPGSQPAESFWDYEDKF